jgi:hypothetical protein
VLPNDQLLAGNQRLPACLNLFSRKANRLAPAPDGPRVMIEKIAGVRSQVLSEFLDLNYTSKFMTLVFLLIPKCTRDAGRKLR